MEWISVNDQLPNGDTFCLVVVNGKPEKNITLHGAYELAEYDAEEGWVFEMWPLWTEAEVTHWTPLPPPPSKDGD